MGGDQNHLRNDHRLGRVEQLQHAEWSRVRQQQVDNKTRHNGREPHQCIQECGHRAPSREAVDRQHTTEGEADEGGNRHSYQRDLEGQPDDLDELRIERGDLP